MTVKREWLVPGWSSAVGNPPQLSDIHRCMTDSRLHRSVSIDLVVDAPLGGSQFISIVPTGLRTILGSIDWTDSDMFEDPEFEFEGWVVKPPFVVNTSPVWIRGSLRTERDEFNDSIKVVECTIHVMEPGTEMGVRRTVYVEHRQEGLSAASKAALRLPLQADSADTTN